MVPKSKENHGTYKEDIAENCLYDEFEWV